MDEIFENASEMILFIPKSQYRWMYTIDEGKQHIIHQDNIKKFINKYIDKKELKKLEDIILKHQPFIVLIENKAIEELYKEENTLDYYKQKLKNEIYSVDKKITQNKVDLNKSSDNWFSNMISKNLLF